MKKLFTLTISLLLTISATAQNHPFSIRFSHEIETEISEKKMRPSKAGLLYALIGDYHSSIKYSGQEVSWGVDTLDLESYQIGDAFDKIIEEAKSHQLIIISENHLRPQHRIFAKSLINKFADMGFEHLGLETFTNVGDGNTLLDTLLAERGYPLDTPLTGTYTLEPQMSNLVRDAIKKEYQLFAYEGYSKEGKDRDEIQADNIIQYLKKYPASKFVILCGFYHAIESDYSKRGNAHWMAHYVKEKYGLDPLTIYQDNFTEKIVKNEHRILSELNIKSPSVFLDEKGKIARLTKHVDIEVIHPKTIYRNGRPDWLYEKGKNKAVEIKVDDFKINFPVIVSAYPKGELNSVPVERIELKHESDKRPLVLPKGVYRIVLFDGDSTEEYEEAVK